MGSVRSELERVVRGKKMVKEKWPNGSTVVTIEAGRGTLSFMREEKYKGVIGIYFTEHKSKDWDYLTSVELEKLEEAVNVLKEEVK